MSLQLSTLGKAVAIPFLLFLTLIVGMSPERSQTYNRLFLSKQKGQIKALLLRSMLGFHHLIFWAPSLQLSIRLFGASGMKIFSNATETSCLVRVQESVASQKFLTRCLLVIIFSMLPIMRYVAHRF